MAVTAEHGDGTGDQKAASHRPKWSNMLENRLALLASINSQYDVLWLPYLFYIYKGAPVFLPVFLFFVAMAGVPMLLLEVGIGQYMDKGPWAVWDIAPIFKGIGYVVTILNAHAFWSLSWALMAKIMFCYDLSSMDWENLDGCGPLNMSAVTQDSYDDYQPFRDFDCEMTAITSNRFSFSGREEFDVHGGYLGVMLLLILACCAISAAGIRLLGKFTVTCLLVPCFLMFLLFCRMVSLPGASSGLKYAFYPDFHGLASIDMWAFSSQVSLHFVWAGTGQAVTVGSYNRFNHSFLVDCLIAVAAKLVMLIFSVITMFSAFGAVSHASNYPIHEIARGGLEGMSPVVEVLMTSTPAGGFWTACFLISMLLLTLNSTVWSVETVVSAIWDILPPTPRFRTLRRKPVLLCVLAIPWCAYGIFYSTKGSRAKVTEIDQFVSGPLVLICLLECIAVGWVFGARRFQAAWATMTGRCSCPYPIIFWAIATPIVLFVMFVLQLVIIFEQIRFYLTSFSGILFAFLVVLISAIIWLFTRPGSLAQKWRNVTSPWNLVGHQLSPRYRRYNPVPMEAMPA